MQKLQLVVRLKGATDEELRRAGEAAMAVFEKARTTPLHAAEASFAREGWDLSGFDPDYEGYTDNDAWLANVWQDAAKAAAVAGCASWPAGAQPDYAEMEIVGFEEDDGEEDDDEEEKRQMLAVHLASTTGRQPSEAELEAEYEALIAEMNKAARG